MQWKPEKCQPLRGSQKSKVKSQTTRVVIVRHGQSTYNNLGLYQGSSDESVLTEVGRRDIRQIGDFLKGVEFDAIYSSSLKRARDTAEEILQAIAPAMNSGIIRITPQLRETDLPNWHGLSFQYVRENFPTQYHTWKNRPHEFYMQVDGASASASASASVFYPAVELYKRIRQFWQSILPLHIGQTLLIIAHGGTNRALISTALGIKPERYHCIQQSNCGINVLDFADGCLDSGQLSGMNLTAPTGDNPLLQVSEASEGLRLFMVPSGTIGLQQIDKLTNSLKNTTINFSITEHISHGQVITEQILQHHPQTVQLEVLQQDFSQLWQKAIENRGLMAKPELAVANASQSISEGGVASTNKATHQPLVTGLVVANDAVIKSMITQILGMDASTKRLHLQPGTVSCIHYPSSQLPSVLQTMNN
ncbi:MAG: histidine phosphatase family protein [Calothrix sp. MO_167.B42]|nr:histidine phosphatase family protein [Calothrix sp. MO_167.B42]